MIFNTKMAAVSSQKRSLFGGHSFCSACEEGAARHFKLSSAVENVEVPPGANQLGGRQGTMVILLWRSCASPEIPALI
ncbi:unnamed protein product [Ixodes pacificus]